MNAQMPIGFSQRIRLEWLERTAALLAAGRSRELIQTALAQTLEEKLSVGGTADRGNREKAISILLKIWVSVPATLKPLRDDALEHVRRLSPSEHLPLHWGMTMAVYPFFGVVAEAVGRLLELQGSVAASQLQRRIRELLGERETVARAARRILRCFIDWGVLEEDAQEGVYHPAASRQVSDARLAAWLIEASLVASGLRSGALRALLVAPRLFPFRIPVAMNSKLHLGHRLELFRQGLDEEMVLVR
jgi:hypothetical protein